MDLLIKQWAGESVVIHFDRVTESWILIAIHSTLLGPAIGGTRMKSYQDTLAALQDVLSLAEAMTYKFAAADFPAGGGKAVIVVSPSLDSRERSGLLRRYGRLIHQLGGIFKTGPDVGTSSHDMDIIAEAGAPHVFSCTEQAGGAGDSGNMTAIGVFAGIQAVCNYLYEDSSLARRRILVQGVGSVGKVLVRLLRDEGCEPLFSDIDEALLSHFRDELGLEYVLADEAINTQCDIFAPCALGGILNENSIGRLRCRAVIGAANNQLATRDDAKRLSERGILYAPDFVANVGGAVGITGIEAMGWSRKEAEERVIQSVQKNLSRILYQAGVEGITTYQAAINLAEDRLTRARAAD